MISRLSLTARLTLLFSIGSMVVLLPLGLLIGVAIERHFEEQDRDILEGKLVVAQRIVASVTSPQELAKLPSRLYAQVAGHHDLAIEVLGLRDEILVTSSNVGFPRGWPVHMDTSSDARPFVWSQGSNSYRGLASSLSTGIPGAVPLKVAVAIDIGHHNAFMKTFLRTLWLFVGGAALATGLLGWFAARSGLAPLRAISAQAAAITAHKLDQRLPVDAVPAELADLATTLNEMLERLEEAFRRLSDFSSDLAHELRTPISNLMTQTQVSLSRARTAESYHEVLESNAEELERLARTISDMLFLAKAENGLTLATSEPVDMAREVRGLFEFYEALADEMGIRLELVGEGSLQGDRLMLRRALSNLLSNALRYTSRGGSVVVTIEADETELAVFVDNPGETIPPHLLGRLFERFFRADPSRHHVSGEGTGLGLAITQAIVHAHQGKISAASANGVTRFAATFPRRSRTGSMSG
jgi:two-component system, OmpR family, heavy metal sensor histidine kinase CusS